VAARLAATHRSRGRVFPHADLGEGLTSGCVFRSLATALSHLPGFCKMRTAMVTQTNLWKSCSGYESTTGQEVGFEKIFPKPVPEDLSISPPRWSYASTTFER